MFGWDFYFAELLLRKILSVNTNLSGASGALPPQKARVTALSFLVTEGIKSLSALSLFPGGLSGKDLTAYWGGVAGLDISNLWCEV